MSKYKPTIVHSFKDRIHNFEETFNWFIKKDKNANKHKYTEWNINSHSLQNDVLDLVEHRLGVGCENRHEVWIREEGKC